MPPSPSARSPLEVFEAELARRVNPEVSRSFDVERLTASRDILARLLEHPDLRPAGERFTLVGSNGKGSTAFYLSMIAGADRPDENVGLFTSPHLRSVLERVRVNGRPMSPRGALAALERVREVAGVDWEILSYFELTFLVACAVFRARDCTVRIFEAGLGGRWDATRAALAQNVLLLPIELEHTNILGRTRPAILREKLAVLTKKTRRLFAYPQAQLPERTVRHTALQFAPDLPRLHFIDALTRADERSLNYLELNYRFARHCYEIATGRETEDLLLAGDPLPHPPGRMESRTTRIENQQGERVRLFFEPAHNPPAIQISLGGILTGKGGDYPAGRGLVLLGLLADRDPGPMIALFRSKGLSWRLLAADFLARPPAGTPEDRVVDLERLETDLPPLLRESDRRWCLFLGTHRSYGAFRRLTRQYGV